MKKRILAFLLAVSIAVSMLVMPASAAGNNTAVQFAITLGAMDSEQSGALNAAVTRGAFARMLTSYSTYRESISSQGAVGTLYTDLPGSSAWAPYVRIAVQQGWMNGYTDGSFRPDNAVTLEEAVTAILKLMGYKMTDLSGSFPNAQLNKASELGLRNQVDRSQGEALNYEECALLFYNALTANTASGSAYGSSLGFTVSNGQVDTSSVMLKSLKGPFVAAEGTQLPFAPVSVYRNDKVGLHPPRRWPHHGSFAQCQRPHQCNGGRHQLYAGFLCGGLPGVLPQRRRRGRGRHPAAGHEQ